MELVPLLNADEIMVLQRIASGLDTRSIAIVLSKTDRGVEALEESIFRKLKLDGADTSGKRTYATTLYADYCRAQGVTADIRQMRNVSARNGGTSANVSNGHTDDRSEKVAEALRKEVAALAPKVKALPADLLEVAQLIAEGKSNFDIAKAKSVTINDAGQLVSRLYAALGFDRALKKKRRPLVKAAHNFAYPMRGSTTAQTAPSVSPAMEIPANDKVESAASVAQIATTAEHIGKLSGWHKNFFAELVRAEFKLGSSEDFAEFARRKGIGEGTLKAYLSTMYSQLRVPYSPERSERLAVMREAYAQWSMTTGKTFSPPVEPASPAVTAPEPVPVKTEPSTEHVEGADTRTSEKPIGEVIPLVAGNLGKLRGRLAEVMAKLVELNFDVASAEALAGHLDIKVLTVIEHRQKMAGILETPKFLRFPEWVAILRKAHEYQAGRQSAPQLAALAPVVPPKREAAEQPLTAEERAKLIASMERSRRNMIAEIVYAGDAGYADAAKTLGISTEELLAGMSEVLPQLGLRILSSERTQEALRQSWDAFRVLSRQSKAPPAPPSVPKVDGLRHELRNPETILDLRTVSVELQNQQPPENFARTVRTMRAQGFEPEVAVTVTGNERQPDGLQVVFVRRSR